MKRLKLNIRELHDKCKNELIPKEYDDIEKYILKAVYRYERIKYEYDNLCSALDGCKFYEKYCDVPNYPIYGENNDRQMNGYINADYAVWREMIADIILVEAIMDICYCKIRKCVLDGSDRKDAQQINQNNQSHLCLSFDSSN